MVFASLYVFVCVFVCVREIVWELCKRQTKPSAVKPGQSAPFEQNKHVAKALVVFFIVTWIRLSRPFLLRQQHDPPRAGPSAIRVACVTHAY